MFIPSDETSSAALRQEMESHIKGPKEMAPGESRDGFVFISYSSEDEGIAKRIHDRLYELKIKSWWAKEIQCGDRWNEILDYTLQDAGCIVVLWSSSSTKSNWVMHEASCAIHRGVYAPVSIDDCGIDSLFSRSQYSNLANWNGESDDPEFRRLVRRIQQLLPLRKSPAHRAATWTLENRSWILSSLVAVVALGILIWQTLATTTQLNKLEDLGTEQQNAVNEQRTIADRTNNELLEAAKERQSIRNLVNAVELKIRSSSETIATINKDEREIYTNHLKHQGITEEDDAAWFKDADHPWYRYPLKGNYDGLPAAVRVQDLIEYQITHESLKGARLQRRFMRNGDIASKYTSYLHDNIERLKQQNQSLENQTIEGVLPIGKLIIRDSKINESLTEHILFSNGESAMKHHGFIPVQEIPGFTDKYIDHDLSIALPGNILDAHVVIRITRPFQQQTDTPTEEVPRVPTLIPTPQ